MTRVKVPAFTSGLKTGFPVPHRGFKAQNTGGTGAVTLGATGGTSEFQPPIVDTSNLPQYAGEFSSIKLVSNYHQTRDPDDVAQGSPLYINWSPTLDYTGEQAITFAGPKSQTGYWGARAIVQIEGTVTQRSDAGQFGPGPIGINVMGTYRNGKGLDVTMSPNFAFIAGAINIADAGTITVPETDVTLYDTCIVGSASICDDTSFVTMNTGTYDAADKDWVSFYAWPIMSGNVDYNRRFGFVVEEVLQEGLAINALSNCVGEAFDTNATTLAKDIGYYCRRLWRGTHNVGLWCDSPLELWMDDDQDADDPVGKAKDASTPPIDRGFLASPGPVVTVGGHHTYDYATPFQSVYDVAGTWVFEQTPSAFGMFAGLNIHPTLKNGVGVNTAIPLAVSAAISPTYSLDATAAQSVTVMRGLSINAALSRASGSNTVTVALLSHVYIGGTTVGSNTAVTVENGIRIAALSGATKYAINADDGALFGGTVETTSTNGFLGRDGTSGHGQARVATTALGPTLSLFAATGDTQPTAVLIHSNGAQPSLRFGPGGSTGTDCKIERTGSAAMTVTGASTFSDGVIASSVVSTGVISSTWSSQAAGSAWGLTVTDGTAGHGRVGISVSNPLGQLSQVGAYASSSDSQPTAALQSLAGTGSLQLGVGGSTGADCAISRAGSNSIATNAAFKSTHATGGIGYATGAGGAQTQTGSRTSGVTLNKAAGAITLVSAAGSTTAATFTVTNSAVAATDTVLIAQKSGTDKYDLHISAVAAGSFDVTFRTISGTTTEQPVFNFAVIKAVAS